MKHETAKLTDAFKESGSVRYFALEPMAFTSDIQCDPCHVAVSVRRLLGHVLDLELTAAAQKAPCKAPAGTRALGSSKPFYS